MSHVGWWLVTHTAASERKKETLQECLQKRKGLLHPNCFYGLMVRCILQHLRSNKLTTHLALSTIRSSRRRGLTLQVVWPNYFFLETSTQV